MPEPPPGPGVAPPFPAPPIEGRGLRLGLGFGIGALVVLLFCGGGSAAAVGVGVVATRALNEQAHVVVGDYLDDVKARRYGAAYDSLCSAAKQAQSRAEFVRQAQSQARHITDYHVGDVDLTSNDLSVPVDVTYQNGASERLDVSLEQNQKTGEFQVCSVR
ncbi:Rv0361 family membrane protein [Mangrovihabitans endophyticus]|uniref:Rv0361 family membrane protein n=1 Tax=Mangrovihabitans endophyticus TaxID=1751298 RepID=UPI00166DAE92|nr:hypothetical protein [Mangrovihabitans endophyticus]